MEIKRDRYLKKIISFMCDGQVKVITGIRRCGKSYLLRNLFKSYLLSEGVAEDHILSFELDLARDLPATPSPWPQPRPKRNCRRVSSPATPGSPALIFCSWG